MIFMKSDENRISNSATDMRFFFVEDSAFDYYDVSNNISNKFSNIFKRKSQKNIVIQGKIRLFSVFMRFHYSKGIPYKDGGALYILKITFKKELV